MKFYLYLLVTTSLTFAQTNTEVFLMDIMETGDSLQITNFKNISNTPGYDNQPAFVGNNKLVYAGTETNNTEIILYYLESDARHRLNMATAGGEYSPQPFPTKPLVAAVRLDTTGLQRFYSYEYGVPGFGKWTMLFEELEVAYYAFHDDDRIIASVLAGDKLDLVVGTISKDEGKLLTENTGRSIHKVPNGTSVSYTQLNEDGTYNVYIVDIDDTGESFYVCTLPIGVQDHIWLSNSKLLIGSNEKLFMLDLFKTNDWYEVANLSEYNLSNITRMAVSPNRKHLSFVAIENLK
jgi:hypothetical protein